MQRVSLRRYGGRLEGNRWKQGYRCKWHSGREACMRGARLNRKCAGVVVKSEARIELIGVVTTVCANVLFSGGQNV